MTIGRFRNGWFTSLVINNNNENNSISARVASTTIIKLDYLYLYGNDSSIQEFLFFIFLTRFNSFIIYDSP